MLHACVSEVSTITHTVLKVHHSIVYNFTSH